MGNRKDLCEGCRVTGIPTATIGRCFLHRAGRDRLAASVVISIADSFILMPEVQVVKYKEYRQHRWWGSN